MTLTPNQLASRLINLDREMHSLTKALGELDREAVKAREGFTLAFAKAFLRADGAMDVRRYVATEATHMERLTAETAEASVRDKRAQVRAVESSIDVARSLNSLTKAEMSL
jgi:hypothetical protein